MTTRPLIPALLLGGALLTAGCMTGKGHDAAMPGATATLADASGAARGTVTFTESAKGIAVSARATGLPPGPAGIHVHAVGKCEGPTFASAGPHWNPTMHQHGMENPSGAHMGDMPNIVVGADGSGTLDFVIAGAKLREGPNPLLDADGAAVVVHAAADDYKTDPSGNSGARVACGVIG